ncbi:hypothetical protein WKK05_40285 (plasmid) [Nostoc sp. UHCC 0302]|uniref:hypothetical protein n=1 Tax=Nostoc sp. UHCC 0302 TaxID=3134896 RepID=UPI00311CD00B
MNTDFSLNSFFNFIKENNKDLNPDHYQIAFRQEGLGVQLVLKYIQGSVQILIQQGFQKYRAFALLHTTRINANRTVN